MKENRFEILENFPIFHNWNKTNVGCWTNIQHPKPMKFFRFDKESYQFCVHFSGFGLLCADRTINRQMIPSALIAAPFIHISFGLIHGCQQRHTSNSNTSPNVCSHTANNCAYPRFMHFSRTFTCQQIPVQSSTSRRYHQHVSAEPLTKPLFIFKIVYFWRRIRYVAPNKCLTPQHQMYYISPCLKLSWHPNW